MSLASCIVEVSFSPMSEFGSNLSRFACLVSVQRIHATKSQSHRQMSGNCFPRRQHVAGLEPVADFVDYSANNATFGFGSKSIRGLEI
jgi:hypothetical protein